MKTFSGPFPLVSVDPFNDCAATAECLSLKARDDAAGTDKQLAPDLIADLLDMVRKESFDVVERNWLQVTFWESLK